MCFSATASFTAAGLLLGVGALTFKSARHPWERPFAAIPLLFAVQQLSEGVLWWTFSHDAPWLNAAMTQFYSFFSHVLWPVYVPVAALLMEPSGWRRRGLLGIAWAGLSVGAYLLYAMFEYPIVSALTGHHVEYLAPRFFPHATMALYLLATGVSLLLSSHRTVRVFGLLSLLSFGAAYLFHANWFISVWCFFAALLSTVIAFHFQALSFFRKKDAPRGLPSS
jgi:hypothetical protein